MNRKYGSSKSPVFYKLYWMNLLIAVGFVCVVSLICGLVSVKILLNNIISFNQDMMTGKINTMDERVQQIKNTVNLIAEEENVFQMMMTDDMDCENPLKLLDTIRYFQNICSNSGIISGICLIDTERELVVTEKTKFELKEKGDYQDIDNQGFFLEMHENEETDENEWQLKFFAKFQPAEGKKAKLIVVTVDQNAFTNELLQDSPLLKTYLVTADGKALKQDGTIVLRDGAEKLNGFFKEAETVEKGKRIFYKRTSQLSNLSLVAYSEHSWLLDQAKALVEKVIAVGVLTVLAAAIIIYRCSLSAYRPLKQLGSKVGELVPAKNQRSAIPDEYDLIETAVNELQSEKNTMLPAVVRDMVQKLLTNEFDQKCFDCLRETYKQPMNHSQNLVVLIENEEPCSGEIVLRSFNEMIETASQVSGFFVQLTTARCVGILNTSFDCGQVVVQINNVKKRLKSRGITMHCCVSEEFTSWQDLNTIYAKTLQSMERQFFIGENSQSCNDGGDERCSSEQYCRQKQEQLVRYVIEGNIETALTTLQDITRKLSRSEEDIQYTRFVYVQTLTYLVQKVAEMGATLPKEYNEKHIFNRIFHAQNLQQLEQISEKMLYVCLSNFGQSTHVYSQNVEKVIAFLKEHYMMDLSLDDVASAVFLSSGYLSILFKDETGYTVMEYLTKIRMKKAEELVCQTPLLKIKDISERVGYNNVQSFIRYFKKHYGESPVSYRKRITQ